MTASQIVARTRNLPHISQAALSLVSLLEDVDDSLEQAIELIRADGYLTLKLLRACNSAAFGLGEPVGSVDQALMLVGFEQVRRMVISAAFGPAVTQSAPAYSMDAAALWRHAFVTASVAEHLVTGRDGQVEASAAFTAGLLHDIGKVIMNPVLTEDMRAAIDDHVKNQGLRLFEAERKVVGSDHAEVGSCLLHMWRLPGRIVEAVANHHRPILSPTPQLSAIAYTANCAAHVADLDIGLPAGSCLDPDQPAVAALGLDREAAMQLLEHAKAAAEKAKELQSSVA